MIPNFRAIFIFLILFTFLITLSYIKPTSPVTSAQSYIPPSAIDPQTLVLDQSVQEKTKVVQSKLNGRGFGMGFSTRSNYWLDMEGRDLIKLTSDISDMNLTSYGERKIEPKIQITKIKSWGEEPITAIPKLSQTDLNYYTSYATKYLVSYPEITTNINDFNDYCTTYKSKVAGKFPKLKFSPLLSYEYFSGQYDNIVKWDKLDQTCLDFLAIISYPSQKYTYVSQLKPDYYQDLKKYFPNKDLVFVDTGWSTLNSSKEEQSKYLELLYQFAKTNPEVKSIIYGHLFDPFENELYYYQGTGLITKDEIKKPSYYVWKNLFDRKNQ